MIVCLSIDKLYDICGLTVEYTKTLAELQEQPMSFPQVKKIK